MKNNLAKFLAFGSLVVGGTFLATNPAKAALITGSELQFNASLVFYDADPGPGNQLTALFTNTYNDFSSVALLGDYGQFDILNSSTDSFAPYIGADVLEIVSLQFPSIVPNVDLVLGTNRYVGAGAPVPFLHGSALTPDVSPFNTPILRLSDPGVASSPTEFFIDRVTSFFDDVPSGEDPFSYTFRATGHFRDAHGVAGGRGRLNGTFDFGNPVLVDILTGNIGTCTEVSDDCVAAITSTFGATFVVEEKPVAVPEASNLVGLVGLGLLGSFVVAKRKKEVIG